MRNSSRWTNVCSCNLRGIKWSVPFPDTFLQQNVSDAKQAFEEEAVPYQLQWGGGDKQNWVLGCAGYFVYYQLILQVLFTGR